MVEVVAVVPPRGGSATEVARHESLRPEVMDAQLEHREVPCARAQDISHPNGGLHML